MTSEVFPASQAPTKVVIALVEDVSATGEVSYSAQILYCVQTANFAYCYILVQPKPLQLCQKFRRWNPCGNL
jgi:hypothetical protein